MYPVHIVLPQFPPELQQFLIVNEYTSAGFLRVCTSTDEHEEPEEWMEEHRLEKDWSVVTLSDALPAHMKKKDT